MRTTIDAAGRLVVPKAMRQALGLSPGTQLELEAVDGRLEITIPSRVRVEHGPRGLRFSADAPDPLDPERVRELVELGRR